METYHIACHCQAHILRYTVPAAEAFTDNGVCDCSHCLKRRIVWIMTPTGSVEVIKGVNGTAKGEKVLQGYSFGSKQSVHQFCGECGTHLLGGPFDDKQSTMLNARAIRDANFNLWEKPLKVYPGLDRPPQYTHTTLADLPGAEEYLAARAKEVDHPTEVRVGSCHCQAIKFASAHEPFEKTEVIDCSCSICTGNGVLWVYPARKDVYFYPHASDTHTYRPPSDMIVQYTFNQKGNIHCMCKICGCQVYEYRPKGEASNPNPDECTEGSLGLNAALFSDAIEYFGDIQGLRGNEGHRGKTLEGWIRNEKMRSEGPKYQVRL